jgi:Tetratricopeptide repeat
VGRALALAMGFNGKHAESSGLHRSVLQLQTATLGPDHPDTLLTAQQYAFDKLKSDPEQARLLLADVLGRQRRVLGDDDRETFQTARFLANVLFRLGHVHAAGALLAQQLPRQRAALGEEHPFTHQTAGDLAECLVEIGELAQARDLAQQTLASQQRQMGEDSPNAFETAELLVRILVRQNHSKAAARLAEQTIDRIRRHMAVNVDSDYTQLLAELNLAIHFENARSARAARADAGVDP